MSRVVFTGGARSGKSRAATELARVRQLDGASVVVAVFGRESGDAEMSERVERHRASRPDGFGVIEAADSASWTRDVPPESLLLVDCVGTLLGSCMDEAWTAVGQAAHGLADAPAETLPAGFEVETRARFDGALSWLLERKGDTVLVTNEAGDGVVPAYATARLFRDLLGEANRRLVGSADSAYLCVAGKLLSLHHLPDTAHWPED